MMIVLPPLAMGPVWMRVGGQAACVHVSGSVRMSSSPAHTTSPLAFRMASLLSMEAIQHLTAQVSNEWMEGVGRGEKERGRVGERECIILFILFVGPRICGSQENCSYGFGDGCFGPRGSHGSILTISFYTFVILQSLMLIIY